MDDQSHPQLLPGLQVLERGTAEVQIGLDPRHAVVAGGLDPEVIEALRALDGRRTLRNLLEIAGEHTEEFKQLLTGLHRRGLLREADPKNRGGETGLWALRAGHRDDRERARRRHCAVVVRGEGRLATAVAALLATAGVGHIDVVADGTVGVGDLGTGLAEHDLGTSRRQAIAEAVHRVDPTIATTRLFGDRKPDLVLLTDAVVPAPEVLAELMAAKTAHLPVRIRDGIGIVGPLVVPGRTSCLTCADLHRTELDQSWPRIAGQLAGRALQACLADVQSCAALAAAQTLRALCADREPPPVWNTTLELDAYAGTVKNRWWPPHAKCQCRAR
ncbi:ThiF family adenylyltransferase [Amycolatopsis sp. NPDC059657]|uniref:ThiF family adenylyltransferase n=1 Tax=Amycolatopsis sp. NPDC059657 TaxID=3346899 RepID=UPI0036733EBB